jgi:hypothetical protein
MILKDKHAKVWEACDIIYVSDHDMKDKEDFPLKHPDLEGNAPLLEP